MVWSCITTLSVGKLCILYTTVNSEIYASFRKFSNI